MRASVLLGVGIFLCLGAASLSADDVITGVITGTVVEEFSGTPLAGAGVRVLTKSGMQHVTTSANGRFVVQVPEGPTMIRAVLYGYRSDDIQSVVVRARLVNRVVIRMRACVRLLH